MLTTTSGEAGSDAGTLFEGNSATTNGGAVYVQNGTVDLGSGTRLQGNQAVKGGAIYALGGKDASAKLTFADAVFGKNSGHLRRGCVLVGERWRYGECSRLGCGI